MRKHKERKNDSDTNGALSLSHTHTHTLCFWRYSHTHTLSLSLSLASTADSTEPTAPLESRACQLSSDRNRYLSFSFFLLSLPSPPSHSTHTQTDTAQRNGHSGLHPSQREKQTQKGNRHVSTKAFSKVIPLVAVLDLALLLALDAPRDAMILPLIYCCKRVLFRCPQSNEICATLTYTWSLKYDLLLIVHHGQHKIQASVL